MLQAALNGRRTRADHPAIPLAPEEIAADAAACVAAGASAVHAHPRGDDGLETLDRVVVDEVAGLVRAIGVPVSVTTGAWIEGRPDRRRQAVAAWRGPDQASVNLSEEGALEVARALRAAGIGVEAGVWSLADARLLVDSGLQVARVLIELFDEDAPLDEIHALLDTGNYPDRLQHGEGATTWPLLVDAVRRGVDTRIGLEDTLHLPDGRLAGDNVELVRVARELGAA